MQTKTVKFVDKYTQKECVETLPNESRCQFLEKRNKKNMNDIALTFENRRITYEELHERIDEYATALYQIGIREEEKIAINVLNTPEAVYLLYALDKIGCTVVGLSPLNNEYKMQRDIEIAKPNRIISTDIIFGKAKKAADSLNISPILFPINDLETDTQDTLHIENECNLFRVVEQAKGTKLEINNFDSKRTTDILFTGGSTGVHKGVELIGNGLNCIVQALDHVYYLEAGMTHLGNISLGHMVFGRLVLHYALANNLNYALTLKTLPQDGGSKTTIGDGFGLTEMWSPTHICLGGKNTENTIGYAIPYVESKIVDENFNEVENGEFGTLLVKGPGMMKGYYNNAEETKKVFWYDGNGEKWYNTGDLARNMGINNNEYEYVGRKKRNFVCGVDNIYPEQIEELLLQIPNIREAVVTKIPDDKYQYLPKYHISVFNKKFNQKEFENSVKQLVSSTLGQSAAPGYIEYTEEPLPRTDNGKLNATLLEQLDIEDLQRRV